jgi:hypothetical protein
MGADLARPEPVEYHPLATDAATGQSTDLRPLIGGPEDLRGTYGAARVLIKCDPEWRVAPSGDEQPRMSEDYEHGRE